MRLNTAVSRMMRWGGCAALLALLAASSYAGRSAQSVPIVPVMMQIVPDEALAASTVSKTTEQLARRREDALALLESVLGDPAADEAARKQALLEKTRIAARMEKEAALCALLAHMGFDQTAVIAGEDVLSIVAPWQIAENEQSRLQMIDAAAAQSGFSADAIKIILAKK